ncbi:MAG: hypothetical protein JWR01_1095, partial [Subtercola sp.]|nr:hypothetical protein [Subtercola sp.]
ALMAFIQCRNIVFESPWPRATGYCGAK